MESLGIMPGDIIYDGAVFSVYTNCPYAAYVEFGTGVIGENSPHPDTSIAGWKYDINDHGEAGWIYFKDGKRHWTNGMPARPFMFETAQYLSDMSVINHIAREVFEVIDASNRVLTNIKTYVKDTCKNVSNYSSKSPPSFPAVSVVQIDNQDACMDLKTVRMLSSP